MRAGRIAPMAKTMLVPEAWSKLATKMPQAWLDMYAYSNAVMEPWDGPAALAMTDGRWVCGGLDRNGLRPMRYVVTGDGLVIAGSEAGMVPTDEMSVVEKGALGPGQLLAVDMGEGRLYHDAEIKDMLAASQPFGEWVGSITDLEDADRAASRSGRSSRAPSCGGGRSRPATRSRSSRRCSHADGRGRQGGDRLDGRRHAARGALGPLPAAQPLLPAELQPGDQPADRLACASTG